MPRHYAPKKRVYHRRFRRYTKRRFPVLRRSRPEIKRIETQLNTAGAFQTVSTAGKTINFGKGLVQGTNYNQRVGDKINIVGYQFYGQLQGGQSNLATDEKTNYVRIMIMSTQQGASPTPLPNFDLPINRQTVPNVMKVYIDRMISLQTPGRDSTGYLPATRMVKFNVKLRKPFVIKFPQSGSTTPVVDLICWAVSDSSVVPNPGFLNGWLRVFYTDN